MKRLVLAAVLAALASTANAASVITTGTFGPLDFNRTFNDTDSGDQMFATAVDVDGLAAFDPSLGTLQAINVTVDVGFEYSYTLSGGNVLDENQPHGMSASFWFDNLGFDIIVNDSGTGFGYGTMFEPALDHMGLLYPSCGQDLFDGGPCSDSIQNESGSATFGGDILPTVISNGLTGAFLDAGGTLPSNLVSFYFIYPESIEFSLDNVDHASVDFSFAVAAQGGTVALEYVYAPVPEPGTWAMVLGGLALLGLTVRGRRRG